MGARLGCAEFCLRHGDRPEWVDSCRTLGGKIRPRAAVPELPTTYGELMGPTAKSVFRTMSMLGVAAVIGVTAATFATCGVGLAHRTGTWCALPLFWFIGFPLAIGVALIFGLPLAFVFWKLRLTRWWQFGIAGFTSAIPLWIELAQPFTSVRWAQSGLYDSLNSLGSGLASGLAYWWISQKIGVRNGSDEMPQDSDRLA